MLVEILMIIIIYVLYDILRTNKTVSPKTILIYSMYAYFICVLIYTYFNFNESYNDFFELDKVSYLLLFAIGVLYFVFNVACLKYSY